MSYQLKCKAIALEVEAKAFKKQEARERRLLDKWKTRAELGRIKAGLDPMKLKVHSVTAEGIRHHRLTRIRPEARNALLAYGFLRGMPYHKMENFSWTQPNWDRILKLATRYSKESEQVVAQRFAQWLYEAKGDVKAKFHDTVVPGSIKSVMYDPEWVHFQDVRNSTFIEPPSAE